ncbi:MAG: hypothetical protein ACK4YO_03485 [Candidatus Altarchaeaceae archaeon]
MNKKYIIILLGIFAVLIIFISLEYFKFSEFYDIKLSDNYVITNVWMTGNFLYPNITIENPLKPSKTLKIENKEYIYTVKETDIYEDNKLKGFIQFILLELGLLNNEREGYKIKINETNGEFIKASKKFSYNIKCNPVTEFLLNKNSGLIDAKILTQEGCTMEETYYSLIYPEKNYTLEERSVYDNALGRYPNWYSQWMSALDEKFSWKQTVRRNMSLNVSGIEIYNKSSIKNITILHCSDDEIITIYNVKGIENLDGVKCFKVFAISEHKEYDRCKNFQKNYNENTTMITRSFHNISAILWIDYDERILVKAIFFDKEYGRIIEMKRHNV